MSSELIIGLIVAAVVVVLFLVFSGKKKPQLPTEVARPAPPPAPPAQPPAQKASPQRPAPTPSAEPTPPPVKRHVEPSPHAGKMDRGTLEISPDELEVHEPAILGERRASAEDVAQLKKGLANTRGGFITRLAKLFGGKKEIDPALLEQIEEVLITADIGMKTTQRILERLRDRMSRRELTDDERVWAALRDEAREILASGRGSLQLKQKPSIVLVVGVNGVGKTTTIGKLASRLSHEGKKVVLAAGDTFRAAAVLQLDVWGKRVNCPVVKGKENADPASVVFDAVKRAADDGADVLIIDTAGRLHTKAPLMEELKKVGRTVEKALGRPADEVLLVLDATNGQNALQQASMFREALPVSGIVLTKLDGTAKGGVVLGIVEEQRLPIRFIGIGERVEDLREFEPQSFVEALFERPESESSAA
jgi:fused signal recognition particle receptor